MLFTEAQLWMDHIGREMCRANGGDDKRTATTSSQTSRRTNRIGKGIDHAWAGNGARANVLFVTPV
jgi:hypothetical protein